LCSLIVESDFVLPPDAKEVADFRVHSELQDEICAYIIEVYGLRRNPFAGES